MKGEGERRQGKPAFVSYLQSSALSLRNFNSSKVFGVDKNAMETGASFFVMMNSSLPPFG